MLTRQQSVLKRNDYLKAGLVTAGVVLFSLGKSGGTTEQEISTKALLICVASMFVEAIGGYLFQILKKRHPAATGDEITTATTVYNVVLALIHGIFSSLATATGELDKAAALFAKRPQMLADQLAIAGLETLGFYFKYCVFDCEGMLAVNFWMTARKAVSSVLSMVFFNAEAGLLCVGGVVLSLASIGVELRDLSVSQKQIKPKTQ